MDKECIYTTMEINMKDNGWITKDMDEENTFFFSQMKFMMVIGLMGKNKDKELISSKQVMFIKEGFWITKKMGLEK